jgi:hypothetical protein
MIPNGIRDKKKKEGGLSKVAYFYLFADNHIYNFDYENTFIDEIIRTKQGVTFPRNPTDSPSYSKSEEDTHNTQSDYAKILGESPCIVKSITNEEHNYIVYEPIVDPTNSSQVLAVLEICWES